MPIIRINLLPKEARKAENTPLPRLLVTLGGTAIIAVMFFSVLWLFAAGIPSQKRLKTTKEQTLAQQKVLAKKADKLQAEVDKIHQRVAAITYLHAGRVLWAPQLDWICSIVPEDIWLTSLDVKKPKAARKKGGVASGPVVTLKAFCTSTDEKRIASFFKKIKEHPNFLSNYQSAEWTTVTKSSSDEGDVLGFSISLGMKPRMVPAADSGKKRPTRPRGRQKNGNTNVASGNI